MRSILTNEFFKRKTTDVAKSLLGKFLVRKIGEEEFSYMITEVEAYIGPHDLASHASKGCTNRTEVMYKEGGTVYVYLIYGMHYMLNIVTERKEYPAAILIRGLEGLRGPGVLARELKISLQLNGAALSKDSGLWIEDRDEQILSDDIISTPRIGVLYAGKIWANKKLRYVLKQYK